MDKQILFDNIDRIHTTAMGVDRIKKNLSLNEVDVVEWCKSKIMSKKAEISKQGKNWYICILDSRINMTRLAPLLREPHIFQPAC